MTYKDRQLATTLRVMSALAACFLAFSGAALAGHKPNHNPGGGGNDTTPPDAVTDLMAATAALGSVSLTWTAVGDDGGGGENCAGAGKAALYDVRYSTSPINDDVDFDVATPAVGEPDPRFCGGTERFCLDDLDPGVNYYAALKVEDEAGNVSSRSNVPFGLRPGPRLRGRPPARSPSPRPRRPGSGTRVRVRGAARGPRRARRPSAPAW